jgi:hypothetical protein
MKIIYEGRWSANNSTFSNGWRDTNKKRLAKDMRFMARGNTFAGNTGAWEVYKCTYLIPDTEPIMSGKVYNCKTK